MNLPIDNQLIDRINKCVFDMRNGSDFYERTGIHIATLTRIITRGWADEEQKSAIVKYCDMVESSIKHVA